MKDLAPNIVRQRLLIEGLYTIDVDSSVVEGHLPGITSHLNLRTYGAPVVHAPAGLGKQDNEAFDAFMALA